MAHSVNLVKGLRAGFAAEPVDPSSSPSTEPRTYSVAS